MGKRFAAVFAVFALLAGFIGFTSTANAVSGVTVSDVSPNSGPEAGGTTVVITGTGFTGVTDVAFGANPTAAFTVDSDTQITAVTPSGTAGPADLMIVGDLGMAIAPGAFTYEAAATVPDTILDLAATAGDTEVALTWSAPGDGGSPITAYGIYYRDQAVGGLFTYFGDTLAPGVTVTGLTNGVTYEFYVDATNAVGTSMPSNTPTATPTAAATAPDAPTGLTIDSVGDGEVSLSWTAPASDGGSPITEYTVAYYPTIAGGTQTVSAGTSTSKTVTGLTNGTEYTFYVWATNAIGSSAYSSEVTATPDVPAPTEPGVPTDFLVTAGEESLSIAWNAPASDGGSALIGYEYVITINGSGGGSGTVPASVTNLDYPSGSVIAGTEYCAKVRAQNAVGYGPWTTVECATPTAPPATAPSAPQYVSAVAGNGQVTVVWDAPASDGGSPITEYGINYDDGQPAIMVTAPATSYTITGLTNGTTYTIGVYAVNAVGNSALSNTVTVTPAAPAPAPAPVQDPAPQTATVTWNGNGATCVFDSSTVPVGTTVNAPDCTAPSGYNFLGWDREVPFVALNDVTVTAKLQKVPGTLTITDAKVLPESIKFTYAYDDLTPVDTFVVVDETGTLACSSTQGTENANTCTAVGAKPGKYFAFAKANGVEGPRTEFEAKSTAPWTKKFDFIVPATSVANQGSMTVRVENVEPGCQVAYRLFNPGGIRKFTALRIANDDATSSARVQFGGWRGDWTVQVAVTRCPTAQSDSFEEKVRVRAN